MGIITPPPSDKKFELPMEAGIAFQIFMTIIIVAIMLQHGIASSLMAAGGGILSIYLTWLQGRKKLSELRWWHTALIFCAIFLGPFVVAGIILKIMGAI